MTLTTVRLHAAGSLERAMGEIADEFETRRGVRVERAFGPSGLLRERIAAGEPAEAFVSADLAHPQALADLGRAAPVVLFARNRLCALVQPSLDVTSDTLLDSLLSEDVRVGTSTPGADPSGDYAWELFERAETLRPGAFERLADKALQLTGGPDSEAPPDGRDPYAWVMQEDRADIFLTYCTNAVPAVRDMPDLRIVAVPVALAVGADYGMTLVDGASLDAAGFALFVLSIEAQRILDRYGFEAPGLPSSVP